MSLILCPFFLLALALSGQVVGAENLQTNFVFFFVNDEAKEVEAYQGRLRSLRYGEPCVFTPVRFIRIRHHKWKTIFLGGKIIARNNNMQNRIYHKR